MTSDGTDLSIAGVAGIVIGGLPGVRGKDGEGGNGRGVAPCCGSTIREPCGNVGDCRAAAGVAASADTTASRTWGPAAFPLAPMAVVSATVLAPRDTTQVPPWAIALSLVMPVSPAPNLPPHAS